MRWRARAPSSRRERRVRRLAVVRETRARATTFSLRGQRGRPYCSSSSRMPSPDKPRRPTSGPAIPDMSNKDLFPFLEAVRDRATFLAFAQALADEKRAESEAGGQTDPCGRGSHGWENHSIEDFLSAAI